MMRYGCNIFGILNSRMLASITIAASTVACSTAEEDGLQKLTKYVHSTCAAEERCTIRAAKVFEFDWERLIVLGPMVNGAGAENIVGRALPMYKEFCTSLIFLDSTGNVKRFEQVDCRDGDSTGKGPIGRSGGFLFTNSSRIMLTRERDVIQAHRIILPTGEFIEYSAVSGGAEHAVDHPGPAKPE